MFFSNQTLFPVDQTWQGEPENKSRRRQNINKLFLKSASLPPGNTTGLHPTCIARPVPHQPLFVTGLRPTWRERRPLTPGYFAGVFASDIYGQREVLCAPACSLSMETLWGRNKRAVLFSWGRRKKKKREKEREGANAKGESRQRGHRLVRGIRQARLW